MRTKDPWQLGEVVELCANFALEIEQEGGCCEGLEGEFCFEFWYFVSNDNYLNVLLTVVK